jgi:hypothetical protein
MSDRILAPNQTAFVKGRFILESVVPAHEIIQDAMKNKDKGLVLKLDYEKTYDKMDWDFLEEVLTTRGFGPVWRSWVLNLVKRFNLVLSGAFISSLVRGWETPCPLTI